MNTYLIPIYNDETGSCIIKKYMASSIDECEEKIICDYSNKLNVDWSDWDIFISEIWEKYGIFIGRIYDIEEL